MAVAVALAVAVAVIMAVTIAIWLVGSRIDSNKTARRSLRGLRWYLSYMARAAAVHERDVGGTQRTHRRHGACSCPAV